MNLKKALSFLFACAGLVTAVYGQNTIKPNTAIKVAISGVPPEETSRVNGDYPVSDSGSINLPYIGQMNVGGSSPSAAALRIQASYKSAGIFRNPTIQVFSATNDTLERQMVHVAGKVRSPGPKEFTQGLTILQAISAAGGADDFGAMNRVLLTRGGKIRVLNLKEASNKGVVLEQNDQIEVPGEKHLGQLMAVRI